MTLDWLSPIARARLAAIGTPADPRAEIERLTRENKDIHDRRCLNLNPATNVMNPRAEALMSQGLGSRPSLGHAGEKYEMGLEAVEQIEVLTSRLACELFDASFAEIRVPSGAMANLMAFMATCRPGDTILAPPAEIAGHVTHHTPGCAGLFGLNVVPAPVDPARYTVDIDRLAHVAREVRPRLITLGQSLNLHPHPIAKVREIADDVGAALLFDAAHACGVIAGEAWPNPLDEGAHLMTMSTYKSLGGPPGGLIVTRDDSLAKRLDAIAFPGMTANFDAGRVAALGITLQDWLDYGTQYAATMIETAQALSDALKARDVPVFAPTRSHQFALVASEGGQSLAKRLAASNLLASGIGLPGRPVAGDMNGLRIGTPELVRRGMRPPHMDELAALIARARLGEDVAEAVTAFRAPFDRVDFAR